MQVHAFCVLSNHFHLIVTDPEAHLPAFEQYLDSLVARAVNASFGRWESFWAPSSYSAVVLASPADIIDKTAYVLANPVAAGLVRQGRDWPGLWSAPDLIGGPALKATRPRTFFNPSGAMPEHAELALVAPPGFDSADEFRARLVEAVGSKEQRAHGQVASKGRGFLGVAKVLAQRPYARPAPGEPRRGLVPRVAAHDRWKRIETLSRLASFLKCYRDAWQARRAGNRDAVFPAGTYLLRLEHGVPCAAT